MRRARVRRDSGDDSGSYYHLFSHAMGESGDRPFGDVEKKKLVELITQLDMAFAIEVIGYAAMGNHYHIVLFAPHDPPGDEEALRCWDVLYGGKNLAAPTPTELANWAERMRDISYFMLQLQIRFTCWYNKSMGRNRTGSIWNGRFKSTLLEGRRRDSSVWACLKYIELNPVRAKMVKDPADYRWSSWGAYSGTGTHPFAKAFTKHLTKLKGCLADDWLEGDVYRVFRAEMKRTITTEAEERQRYAEMAKNTSLDHDHKLTDPSIWVRADRRVRYWTDGLAVGSKEFIRGIYATIRPDATDIPEFATGSEGDWQGSIALCCLRSAKRKKPAPIDPPDIAESPPPD